ncbi:MAG: hypothetical protein JSW61_13055 [Candidatus Thorarchaeota archaeon]|nr:MAG: hypothetical protein JSW61_13055 [Candidatus Thorarchaeota archaeon]
MKEKITLADVEAAVDAFSGERLRWLIGKGDILVQGGKLTQRRFDELVEKTVRDEVERSNIERVLATGPATITKIAKQTRMDKERILWNLLAMLKWNRVEIVGDEKREYVYDIKEV